MSTEKTTARNGRRMLAAMYRLSKGTAGVSLAKADVYAEIRREALFDLDDAGFAAYETRVRAEVAAHRAAGSTVAR